MGNRNPFELVVARRRPSVQGEPVVPELPYVEVEGFEYVVMADPRVQAPELPLAPPVWGKSMLERGFSSLFNTVGVTTGRFPPATEPLCTVFHERREMPEVLFREAVRASLRKGLDPDKMREIWELEIVDSVMES